MEAKKSDTVHEDDLKIQKTLEFFR